MFRDMTLGQYYPADSLLHRLDPRTKLFGTLIYIISIFVVDSLPGMLLIIGALAVTIILSKVPFSFMVRGLRGIVTLLVVAALFNLFLSKGNVIFSFWIFKITDTGLKSASIMIVRMVILIVGTSILTLTTTPNELTDGLEKGLRGLKLIGVPVHEIAMMMSIALRFIPILVEETDKIMKAQMARGADFETGNIFARAKAMVPILVPLFVSAFRRANDLALAMEARCYNGGDGRTKMKPLKYARRDAISYILIFVFLAACIVVNIVL